MGMEKKVEICALRGSIFCVGLVHVVFVYSYMVHVDILITKKETF